MAFLYGYCIIFIISIQYFNLEGMIYSVSSYGAYPNDNIDDTNGVQTAISTAIANGSNNIVLFQSGTYDFSMTVNIYGGYKLQVIGQGMQQTQLLVHMPIALFNMDGCQKLTIGGFSIDFTLLPFTAGYVVNVQASYLDVQVVAPQQADVGQQVGAILRYDTTLGRPAIGSETYEIYQTPPPSVNTTLVSTGVLRIPLASPTLFAVNDAIIARYSFTTHVLYGQDMTDFTIQSVTIYTSWYMGIFTLRVNQLNVYDYHVKPNNGRWMSTTADCMHFADSRSYINIVDTSCEAQGDDGLNVQAFYFTVVQQVNTTAIIIRHNNWFDVLNVGVGTKLEFSSSATPFTPYATATVASYIVANATYSQLFTFTSPINVNVGDMVCVSNTPSLTIKNLMVANNRARGVLLETRGAEIIQSMFNATSGPAILFQPSLYWYEGPAAQNVFLSQNVYINCNQGIVQNGGVITLLPDPVQVVPTMLNILIASSTFISGAYTGSAMQCTNGGNVLLSGNYIALNTSTTPVTICNSQNISAANNSLVNNPTSQFFTYDTTAPCQTSLSSTINITGLSFNSLFPPPVNVTPFTIQGTYQFNISTSTTTISTLPFTSSSSPPVNVTPSTVQGTYQSNISTSPSTISTLSSTLSSPPPVTVTLSTVQGTYQSNTDTSGSAISNTRSCATTTYLFMWNRVIHFILVPCWMICHYFHQTFYY